MHRRAVTQALAFGVSDPASPPPSQPSFISLMDSWKLEGALDFLFAYDYRFSTAPTLICRLESEFTDKQVNTVLH